MLRTPKKLLTLAALAFISLSSTGNAAADSFGISPASTITAASLGTITFTAAGFITIQCNMTLVGSLISGPIPKTTHVVFGNITSVIWSGCSGGTLNSISGTPWAISYLGILGTLPTGVTGVAFNIWSESFTFTAAGTTCSYSPTTVPHLLGLSGSNPYSSGLFTIGTNSTRGSGTSILCGFNGSFRGTFGLRPQQTFTRL